MIESVVDIGKVTGILMSIWIGKEVTDIKIVRETGTNIKIETNIKRRNEIGNGISSKIGAETKEKMGGDLVMIDTVKREKEIILKMIKRGI